MASKRRNMFHKNKTQETTENENDLFDLVFRASQSSLQLQLAPSLEHQTAAMLSILERYKWHRFSVVTSQIAGHDDFIQAIRERITEVQDRFKKSFGASERRSSNLVAENELESLIGGRRKCGQFKHPYKTFPPLFREDNIRKSGRASSTLLQIGFLIFRLSVKKVPEKCVFAIEVSPFQSSVGIPRYSPVKGNEPDLPAGCVFCRRLWEDKQV
ncbi:hypothetical protein AAG570_013566 [Ranatra chinensis]|uniref:Receptor ligand binding region domain-containing protein n=1 Tax=Ranatra chinensis TaxID=642074 RepID=A0ABD0YEG4_9HEMI